MFSIIFKFTAIKNGKFSRIVIITSGISNFSMNFLPSLIIILPIFSLIGEAISKEGKVYRHGDNSPLALIKKRNSSLWELAIPHRSLDDDNEAMYFYDDSMDDNGDRDEFKIACPAHGAQMTDIEAKWKQSDESLKESQLLFLEEYTDLEQVCFEFIKPSIKKLKKTEENENPIYCGKSNAEFYEVGFPVSLDKAGKDIQFIPIYKICHSSAKDVGGTQYTIHRVTSPDLMFLEFWEWFEPDPAGALKSYIDDGADINTRCNEYKYYVYQFVGWYDMPTRIWQWTTYFPFNFISIKDSSVFTGLLRTNHFIQLFSRRANKPLTLYSGTYETEMEITTTRLCNMIKCNKTVTIKLFWRIIVDDDNRGIVLISQRTLESCSQTKYVLCKNDSNHVMLETYRYGGCMYKCPVTETMITKLGLPAEELNLKVEGILPLDFEVSLREREDLDNVRGSSCANAESVGQRASITDFLGAADTFEDAVKAIETEITFDETSEGSDFSDESGSKKHID